MKKNRLLAFFCASALVSVFGVSNAGANSAQKFECNEYPGTEVTDFSGDGSLNISGFGKLAKGELKGSFSTQTKSLIEKADDANRMRVLMTLLAYNCRAIQSSNTTPAEKEKARRDINKELLDAILPKK